MIINLNSCINEFSNKFKINCVEKEYDIFYYMSRIYKNIKFSLSEIINHENGPIIKLTYDFCGPPMFILYKFCKEKLYFVPFLCSTIMIA